MSVSGHELILKLGGGRRPIEPLDFHKYEGEAENKQGPPCGDGPLKQRWIMVDTKEKKGTNL